VLESDEDVTEYLLSQGISVPSGQGYGLSPYFRVSFASALGNLEEACRRIDAAAQRIM
jgi:aspartate aminotransferase